MAQKPALGKGLASLFPGTPPPMPQTPPAAVIGGELVTNMNNGTGAVAAGPQVPVEATSAMDRIPGITLAMLTDIHTNPYQPRREFDEAAIEELSQSIRANGLIQPLVVRRRANGPGYELIAGERRLRACRQAGLKQIPVVVRRSTDRESLEVALVENIQRQDLNCVDTALGYAQLMSDFNLTQEEVAEKMGKDRSSVANHLRLLKLPEAILDDLKRGILSFGHGKALLGVEDIDARLRIRSEIVQKKLSVRETEALVDQMKSEASQAPAANGTPEKAKSPLSALASRMQSLSLELSRHWATRVELKGSERRGKILIHFTSRQELDRLLDAMKN